MWTPWKKKPASEPVKKELKADGWQNIVTGLGTNRDKSSAGVASRTHMNIRELRYLWQADDMAARIVEAIPDEMLRQGWEVKTDDAELAVRASDLLDGLGARKKMNEALRFARAFGGGGILLGVNDGSRDMSDWSKPLDVNKVRSLDFLTVFSPEELRVSTKKNNPLEAGYGEPLLYELHPVNNSAIALQGMKIHESRILRFDGYRTGADSYDNNYGWGNSVLERCYSVLSQFGQTWGSAAHLMTDFSQTVIKMRNLAEALAADKDGYVMNRMRSIDMTRSVLRAVIVDADGEDVDRKTTPITGLPEMLNMFSLRLAAAARMPVSILMGQSPGGLNSTGEGEVRSFYDQVAAQQNAELRGPLNRLYQVAFASFKKVPETWDVSFVPLWQMDDLQKAQLRQAMSAADVAYVSNGILTAEEVALSRFGGDSYSVDVTLDMDARNALGGIEGESNAEAAPEKQEASEKSTK